MQGQIEGIAKSLVDFQVGKIYVVSPIRSGAGTFIAIAGTEAMSADNQRKSTEFLIEQLYPLYGSLVRQKIVYVKKIPKSWVNVQKVPRGYFTANMRRGGAVSRRLSEEKISELYLQQNKSLEDIAQEYGCTRQMVMNLMQKYGIKRRKRSDARVLAIKGGKFERFVYDDINEDFFAQWSPAMAWVLGLLFTDGNFYSKANVDGKGTQFRVSLYSIDCDMLTNVRKHLNSTKPIIKSPQSYDKTKHIYRLEFYREKMREDLIRLGLIERKSLIMKFPAVPEPYLRHFIRGCWDGDGSVYIESGKLRASFISGSEEFINSLVIKLYEAGVYRARLHCKSDAKFKRWRYLPNEYPLKVHKERRSKSGAFYIKISSRESLENLYHCLYDGVDESVYLRRKYEIFVKGLGLTNEELKKHKESRYEYPQVSTRPLVIPQEPEIKDIRKKQTEIAVIRREQCSKGIQKGDRRFLKVNNADGKLKCFKCGRIGGIMFVNMQSYCHDCFNNEPERPDFKSTLPIETR